MATKKLKEMPCRCECARDQHSAYGNGPTGGCVKHFPVCRAYKEMDNMEYVEWHVAQKEKKD